MLLYRNTYITFTFIITLGLIEICGSNVDADELNPGVVSVEKPYGGLTQGEWSAKWWQWVLELPADKNPLTEATGERCANGQGGPVWFLGGVWALGTEQTTRHCTIPSGVGIFFPIFNGECSTAEYPQFKTYTELRDCVIDTNHEELLKMSASVDGKVLQDLKRYKVESPPFNVTLPKNHVLGAAPEGLTPAYAIGWFVMLEPLAKGPHTIEFSSSTGELFATKVIYNILIE